MSYDVPNITVLFPANFVNVSGNRAQISIIGRNFGTTSHPLRTAYVHGKKCLNLTWVSDSSLVCRSDVQKYASCSDFVCYWRFGGM